MMPISPLCGLAGSEQFALLAEIVAARHSCRAFKTTPVPLCHIEEIVRVAGRTASGCNAQPWHVVVTRGAATDEFRNALMQEETRHPGGGPDYD